MLKLLRDLVRGEPLDEEVQRPLEGMLITGQAGLVAGTRVATDRGWRPVEALRVGDGVLGFDRGFQPVIDVQRDHLSLGEERRAGGCRALRVPPRALGNQAPLWLMPDQGLLLESEAAQAMLGEAFVVVPARALSGQRRIAEAEVGPELESVTLVFPQEEAIYVEGGLLALCPQPQTPLAAVDAVEEAGYFRVQTLQTARFLVRSLIEGGDATALGYAPEEIAQQVAAARRGARLAG